MGLIRISYEVVTPESAEDGDVAERGWEDEDGEEHDVESAGRFLQGTEPSSSHFHEGIWYTDVDGDVDFTTGAETRRSYHLSGFSVDEQGQIFTEVCR